MAWDEITLELLDEYADLAAIGTVADVMQLTGENRAIVCRGLVRLADTHLLEICCGPNCPKRGDLAGFAEKTYGSRSGLSIKRVPCMRLCGKGPNVRFDGTLYHQADEKLIRRLVEHK